MSYVVVRSLPYLVPDHHDLAHVVVWLRVRLAVHLAGHAPHGEACSNPHVRLARVLLHVRGVCLLAGLRQLVLHDLRGPGVLLVARRTGGLHPHHVPDVKVLSINTGLDSSWKVCKLEF